MRTSVICKCKKPMELIVATDVGNVYLCSCGYRCTVNSENKRLVKAWDKTKLIIKGDIK